MWYEGSGVGDGFCEMLGVSVWCETSGGVGM